MTFTGIGAAAAALVSCEGPARVAGVPVHFTSHQLCSATFVGGLDPTEFYNETIKPKLGPVGAILRYEIDRERQEVRAHLAGLLHSRAVYDGPFGCRVLHLGREARFAQGKADEPRVVSRSSIAGLGIVAPANDRLSERWIMRLPNPHPGRADLQKPSWCCIAAAWSASAMRPASRRQRR